MQSETVSNLLIWGMGGHSKVVEDTFRNQMSANFALIPEVKFISDSTLESEEWLLKEYPTSTWQVFVAIGHNQDRARIADRVGKLGYRLPNIVHPTAWVSSRAHLGEANIYIGPQVAVCADTVISAGAILNTGSTVDHDCYIGRWVHIAPGVHLCGNVSVGLNSLVGVGASVIPYIQIGADCTIGAGAAVVKDIPSKKTALGVPARIVE